MVEAGTLPNNNWPEWTPMISIFKALPALLILFSVSMTTTLTAAGNNDESWLISNARILDGTGAPGFDGALRIKAGIIQELGDLNSVLASCGCPGRLPG